MPSYYTLPTAIGEAKIANAIALGSQITISELAVGDGGGTTPTPDSDRTSLVNEVRRAPINTSEVDPDNPNWVVVEQVLPPDIGGWTIREVGLYDADGDLIAYGNYPETYKPQLSEGSGRTQTIRFVMQVSDTAAVTLRVDPTVVLATRAYVDDLLDDHEQASTAHNANQIALIEGILQAGDATEVQTALAALAAFASGINQNIAVFDAAGTVEWQVPDALKKGFRKARVTVVGAGGGGGAGDSGYVGEEGASGGAAIRMVDLTGVDAVQITIGLRGSSRTSAQGSSGGSSSFGPYFSATGGEGGRPGPHVEAAEAGRGIGGDINIDGNGGSATHESTELGKQPRPGRPGPLGGGASGGQRLGSGDTVNNRNGRFAGASGAGGTSPNTAGSGKDGMVIVEW